MKVRGHNGEHVGSVERTNAGCWFADTLADKTLGAFRTKAAAMEALRAHAEGQEVVGRVRPVVLFGPAAGGQ